MDRRPRGRSERERRSRADVMAAAQVRRRFRQAQVLMARALGGLGLSALQYHLLLELSAGGVQGRPQGELAASLSVPETRLSTLVRSLTERSLIKSSRAAPDRRVVRLRLTAAGRRLLIRALEGQRQALRGLILSIPRAEMDAMVEWGMNEYLRLPRSG